jgi:predicted DNA-binding protein
MVKVRSKHISARIKPELRDQMQQWARKNAMPISWVVKRVIEVGLPVFLKNPLPMVTRRATDRA